MALKDITLLPALPEWHFASMAVLISAQETEPSSQQTLTDWYLSRLDV